MNETTQFVSAVDSAYHTIRKKILSGELEPGQQLSKRKMAELAGTSVSPVVEALNKLTEDGLVESLPRWGSRVTIYTDRKIEDLYMLREAIECQIARVLAKKMTQEEYQTGCLLAGKLDTSKYGATDLQEISVLHYEFHTMLADMTRYPSLLSTLKRCNLRWMLFLADEKKKSQQELPDGWHKKILDAIMTHDSDYAEKEMRAHVYDSFRDFI